MKTLWLVSGAVAGSIVLLGVSTWMVGTRLPEAHTATVSAELTAAPDVVASRIRDIARHAEWRPDVTRIELVPDVEGVAHDAAQVDARGVVRYVEHGSNGRIPFVFREEVPGRVFTSTIDTDTLPFGGVWTITLEPLDDVRTRVTIREDGVVRSPLFRTISRYVMGHTHSIEAYLRALTASFSA